MDIAPKLLSLSDLFNKRLFEIPEYQRAYSWESKQRNDLFKDIKRNFEKEKREHFMATVVGLRHGTTSIAAREYQKISIVDGQQRITTLIMLYKAISKELGVTADEKKVQQDLAEMLVKHDATVLLLQTNHDTNHYFSKYIRDGIHDAPSHAQTYADQNLLNAINECEEFVRKWKNDGFQLLDLISYINNRISFVYHEISHESLVYTVFEVLNSRGLEVSWFDRLKSMLMGMVFDQKCNTDRTMREIHERWSEIFKIMGRKSLAKEVLRSAATLHEHDKSRMLSEEKSTYILVDRAKGGCDQIVKTVDWIERVARSVVKIHEIGREVSLKKIAHARLVAVAIDLRDDFGDDEKSELLTYCSKVAFYLYGIGKKDSRSAVGEYVRLAYDINTKRISAEHIKSRFSNDIVSSKFRTDVSREIRKLVRDDAYDNWQDELRYLLYRYEEYLAKQSGQNITNEQWNRIWEKSPSQSIEHIWPQSKKRKFVHCLGNLFLLPPGVNSKLSDMLPAKKVEEYNSTGFFMARDIIEHLPSWNKNSVADRGQKIARWMEKEWEITPN